MSLHEEFVAASNAANNLRDIPWDFRAVTGQLAMLAESIPERLNEALTRLKAGQQSYTFAADYLTMRFEIEGDLWKREFDYGLLERLPGYRRIVEVAADPRNDVAFTLAFKKDYDKKNGAVLTTITLALSPEKPFSESIVSYESTARYAGEKNVYITLHIGKNGGPSWAQTKPKAKLSVPTNF